TLVIPAELPDKTFISCLVLSSRHRPLPVWVGAVSALVLQAALAVVAGGLLTLLPKVTVRSVVAALFVGGAVFSGAAAGFALVSVCGVLAGRTITRFVPLAVVRRVSGVALLGFGAYS